MQYSYKTPPSTPDSIFSDSPFKTSPLDEGSMNKSECMCNDSERKIRCCGDYGGSLEENAALLLDNSSTPEEDQKMTPTYFDQNALYSSKANMVKSIDRTDGFNGMNARMQQRIDQMFNPLHFQRQVQHKRLDSIRQHPNISLDRHNERNKYLRQQRDRNERREALKATYRGSMGDFVLKQEDLDMKRQIEKEAGQNQISDVNRFLDDDRYNNRDGENSVDKDMLLEREQQVQQQELDDFLSAERIEMDDMARKVSLN